MRLLVKVPNANVPTVNVVNGVLAGWDHCGFVRSISQGGLCAGRDELPPSCVGYEGKNTNESLTDAQTESGILTVCLLYLYWICTGRYWIVRLFCVWARTQAFQQLFMILSTYSLCLGNTWCFWRNLHPVACTLSHCICVGVHS